MAASYNELFGLGTHSEDASLLGLWPMQEASGNIIDSSANSHDGVVTGTTPTYQVTGPTSYLPFAVDFNGSARFYANMTGITTSSFGIGGWANTIGSNQTVISMGDSSVVTYQHRTFINSSGNVEAFTYDGATRVATGTAALTGWHFYSANFTYQTSREIFLDGVSKASNATADSATNFDRACIGASADSTPFGILSCDAAGMSAFSRVLTAAEWLQVSLGPEPINTIAPAISGTETEDQLLTCTTGTWNSQSNGTATYTYQWTRSNDVGGTGEANIGGATSSTYTLVTADVGKFIRCLVRGTNDGGFDSAADTNSNMSGAIAAASGSSVPVFVHHYAQMQRR